MNIQVLKAKTEDYDKGLLIANPIQNYPGWRTFVNDRDMVLRLNFLRYHAKLLRERFGKASFLWQGSEFKFHCWLLSLDDKAKLLVMTAKGKGTCYEVITSMDDKPQSADIPTVLAFIRTMDKEPAK